jgi:hypothetical protein
MKTLLLVLVVFVALGRAQQNTGRPDASTSDGGGGDKAEVRRLESVTWNPVRSELMWIVSVWDVAVSIDKPAGQERYVIHLDGALMEFEGEARRLDHDAARQLRAVMDLISSYAVASTMWWSAGEDSVNSGTPTPPNQGERGRSVEKPKDDPSKTAPKASPVAPRRAVAAAHE